MGNKKKKKKLQNVYTQLKHQATGLHIASCASMVFPIALMNGKGKAIPPTGGEGPYECETSRLQYILVTLTQPAVFCSQEVIIRKNRLLKCSIGIHSGACAKIKEHTIHIYAQRINTEDFIIDFNAC
jgi:hypothetical protein